MSKKMKSYEYHMYLAVISAILLEIMGIYLFIKVKDKIGSLSKTLIIFNLFIGLLFAICSIGLNIYTNKNIRTAILVVYWTCTFSIQINWLYFFSFKRVQVQLKTWKEDPNLIIRDIEKGILA